MGKLRLWEVKQQPGDTQLVIPFSWNLPSSSAFFFPKFSYPCLVFQGTKYDHEGQKTCYPSPGDLPDRGAEPGSPALQADSLLSEPPGKPSEDRVKNNHHSWLRTLTCSILFICKLLLCAGHLFQMLKPMHPSLEVNNNQKEHSSPRPCAPQTCPFPQNLTPSLHVNDFALYLAASWGQGVKEGKRGTRRQVWGSRAGK